MKFANIKIVNKIKQINSQINRNKQINFTIKL